MPNSISFIHAADLHLDSPFKGLTDLPEAIFSKVKESTFIALDRLVQTAIAREVDFILLVGDLFDHERQSLKAQVRLRDAFETLREHDINVYLSYGNHDFIRGNIYPITYPDNVHIFEEEKVTSFIYEKNAVKLARIYGFSYENRAVHENKTDEYTIIDESIPYHIATLHGSVYGNQVHDTYAPFKISDLQSKAFDYWALGHIHQREILAESPLIVYPGNIQGRHRHELGEKGCYAIELSETETKSEFVPLQAIEFSSIKVDVTNCENIDDLERVFKEALKDMNGCKLIDLTLSSHDEQIYRFETEGILQDLIDIVNETLYYPEQWQYIYQYRIDSRNTKAINYNHFFVGELAETLEDLPLSEPLEDLYRHPIGRKFLDELPEEEIKQEAKNYLFHHLLKMGGE